MAPTSERLFLPNEAYFHTWDASRVDRGSLVTTKCCAQWATSYHAWAVGFPAVFERRADMPASPRDRTQHIEQLLKDWTRIANDQAQPFHGWLGLVLRQGQQARLVQSDEPFPDRLWLSQSQFDVVRGCWREVGLPEDLYSAIPDTDLVFWKWPKNAAC